MTWAALAGAVGGDSTGDLGSRTVREEIDAMKVMGLNPAQSLIAPRLVAAVSVGLLLNIVVAVTAILTGYALNVGTGAVSSGSYLGSFTRFAQPTDLWLAEGKAAIFALIAIVVSSHKGLTATGGPKGVADAINQSVVISAVMLAMVNAGLTQVYVSLVPARVA